MQQTRDYLLQAAFCKAYKKTLSVRSAAAAAKIEPSKHFGWLRGSDENARMYQAAWKDLQEECAQALEDEAIRRAHEGERRPVLYRGKVVRTGRGRASRILYENERSDALLMFVLKRFRPEYRERFETQVTGTLEIVERIQQGRQRLVEMKRDDTPAAAS